jgi:hypothetical protein
MLFTSQKYTSIIEKIAHLIAEKRENLLLDELLTLERALNPLNIFDFLTVFQKALVVLETQIYNLHDQSLEELRSRFFAQWRTLDQSIWSAWNFAIPGYTRYKRLIIMDHRIAVIKAFMKTNDIYAIYAELLLSFTLKDNAATHIALYQKEWKNGQTIFDPLLIQYVKNMQLLACK